MYTNTILWSPNVIKMEVTAVHPLFNNTFDYACTVLKAHSEVWRLFEHVFVFRF